ncbi:CopG family transcriptional regulator [Halostella sp. JP-L12]|uniref:double zinc ribbon domain-containing protein n=1 Tax=Halostella TaxID=1843185 RepID=UPI000EF81FC1|nr:MULTISPECIES: zinc ribbon domain-containing protein [Halostella]NHN47928.1 CopG family transcriptional regulator [Halostella sp. JP-L12]
MSKITFRADDDLIEELERFDASKSEVMREALREYLDSRDARTREEPSPRDGDAREGTIDEIVAERVDALVERRLDERARPTGGQDINVNITLDGDRGVESSDADARKTTSQSADPSPEPSNTCGQCGETVSPDHVYCPNCGEKATHRVFCDCGDELSTDWAFCPGCGRRTPAADVLDPS